MHIIFFHIYYGSDMVPMMVVMMALQIMVTVKWWYIFYKILFHFHYDNNGTNDGITVNGDSEMVTSIFPEVIHIIFLLLSLWY